jgi:hypothetical protein
MLNSFPLEHPTSREVNQRHWTTCSTHVCCKILRMKVSHKLKNIYITFYLKYYLLTVYVYTVLYINSCVKVVQKVCPFNLLL